MFRSIRFALLFWFAVILVGSTAALGTVLLDELRATLYREADAQLAQWTELLLLGPEHLPAGTHHGIWDPAGDLVAASADLPISTPPKRAATATFAEHRWNFAPDDNGGWIAVGRSVRDENHRIREFLTVLLATSAAVIVVALAGGYLLFARTLAPVRRITAAAERISADNLSERIGTGGIPLELTVVTRTLDETFDRLERTFANQARFVADASHELRTPLSIMRAHLDLAMTAETTVAGLRERVAVCIESTQRMQALVTQLLVLARADSGAPQPVDDPVGLGALAREVAAEMEPLAAARDITIRCTGDAATCGNRDLLRDAVTAVVDNAIRYNRAGGEVEISIGVSDSAAEVAISDTGPGIPPEHHEAVFERFHRVDSVRSRERGGSGLGLAIARSLLGCGGGSIRVESSASGGARFVLSLPRA